MPTIRCLVKVDAPSPARGEDVLEPGFDGMTTISADDLTTVSEGRLEDVDQNVIWEHLRKSTPLATESLKELRRFAKKLMAGDVGDVVKTPPIKGGFKLEFPTKERAPLAEGDRVAFNENCSPRYILNCHGTVESASNGKVKVRLDEGDRERLIKSGKSVAPISNCPAVILDKVAA